MSVVAASTGKKTTEGAISAAFLKVATDPRLANDKGAKLYKAIMKTLLLRLRRERAGARLRDGGRIHDGRRAEARGQEPDPRLASAGGDAPERDVEPVRPGGVVLKTSPSDYIPFDQMRMFRYHDGRWNAVRRRRERQALLTLRVPARHPLTPSRRREVRHMRTILRLLVLGCAATGSLALAGTALAKTPQLLVSGSQATAASARRSSR